MNEAWGTTGSLNGIYTITYNTVITNYSEYLKYNQPDLTNNARIEFQWPTGTYPNTSSVYKIPTVSKVKKLTQGVISKSFVSASSNTHDFVWKISINKNETNFESRIRIRDTIGGKVGNLNEQSYTKITSILVYQLDTAGNKVNQTEYSNTDGSLKDGNLVNIVVGTATTTTPAPVDINFAAGVLNGFQADITICTTAVNPNYYQRNNTTTTFTNTAILYSGDTKLSSVSASTKPSNVVLAKSCKIGRAHV